MYDQAVDRKSDWIESTRRTKQSTKKIQRKQLDTTKRPATDTRAAVQHKEKIDKPREDTQKHSGKWCMPNMGMHQQIALGRKRKHLSAP